MLNPLHGRRARPASASWNITKTLLQTAAFWSVFLIVLPAMIFGVETACGLAEWRFAGEAIRFVAGAMFVLGGLLGLTSGITMAWLGRGTPLPLDAPRELVVAGPYRFVRNPMALAGLGQGLAVGLWLGSPAVVLYALTGGPVWNYGVRPWEERDLEQTFGEPYRRYRQAVRCWWPRWRPYAPDSVVEPADTHAPHTESEQS
jgi:protein-S-isoprenylcysteine O-methyltransferase Ste14